MKIGLLSQWFDPEPGPAAIPGIFAREFSRRGNQVSVLTGIPNYPTGKIYPGYSQRLRQTVPLAGSNITRVMLYPSHDRSAARRFLNYSSFAVSASLLGRAALRGVDAIWV